MPEIKRQRQIPVTTPLPELKEFDRLTVLYTVHHEHRGEQPVSVSLGHSRMLKTKDEVYQRRLKVNEEWKAIDLGWVEPANVGCIVIENQVGRGRTVNPTEEELIADNRKVLEVSYTQDSAKCDLVPPGAPDVKWPADATSLYVRCQHGEASCRVTVIPK